MKNLLLIGLAVFTATRVFPQQSRLRSNTDRVLDMRKLKADQNSIGAKETIPVSPIINSGQNYFPAAMKPASTSTINWQLLCGSMNVNGMLVASSRPLQYNPALNAVTFIHRKSTSYQPIPSIPSTAESGVIVAEVSTNWGNIWDSTALWSNASQWGRYPQGAIYNPSGNTSLSNAYIVGCGPSVSGNVFTGNWYASKKLSTFDKTASIAPGAQQFLSFSLSTYPSNQSQHGWSRDGFSSTNDGVVRSLAIIEDDLQKLSTVRGFAVVTGTFNGSAFDWSVDSLIPNCIPDANGLKHLNPDPQMAWNQSGTVGYVVGIGALSTSSLCNKGYQPIVYKLDKTANAAATWTLMQGVDFNSPAFKPLTTHCAQHRVTQPVVNGDTIGIPFVNDYDITVDANNKLHIGMTFMSTATDHPDSLNFISQFSTSINPSELYKWAHVNGSRPLLYDFIGDGISSWKAVLIDSISSEGPSASPGNPGFNENPWPNDLEGGIKVNMDSRIQLGRTPDGQFITFSWVESDSAYTFSGFKWNNLPDIKSRALAIGNGTAMYIVDHGPEKNITEVDNRVRVHATLHYMSPTTGSAIVTQGPMGSFTVNINTPFTVTNSNPYSGTTNNTTWYGGTTLSYAFGDNRTGILNNGTKASVNVEIYPNPAKYSATLGITLESKARVDTRIVNSLGQTLVSKNSECAIGENTILLNTGDLTPGIYFVNIQAGNLTTTKKLIIE